MGQALYQPFYCEENVWHLCRAQTLEQSDKRVAFVSNRRSAVAMFGQRLARGRGAMVWDYHVILFARPRAEDRWQVWDLDTTLGVPVDADWYLGETFERATVPARFHPRFRVIDAREFLDTFASDRSHMRARSGHYLRPPPPWPPIGGDAPSNLACFIDMERPFVGHTVDLGGLRALLAGP